MNRKIFLLIAFLGSLLLLASCTGDNNNTIDEEWKNFQHNKFNEAASSVSGYKERKSLTNNGSVYWKESTVITDEMNKQGIKSLKKTSDGIAQFSDSVVVRYTGWYYKKDGTKYTFDTTEGDANKQAGVGFLVRAVVPGWTDMLQRMREGDEVEVCIPYQLAYGERGNNSIPGYTTLWFNIKLLKIYDYYN